MSQQATALVDDPADEDYENRRRQALIDGLREVADFLEANPAVPVAHNAEIGKHCETLEEYEAACAALDGAPTTGSGNYQIEVRHFGAVTLRVQISRATVLDDRERQLAQRETQATT